MFERFTEKAIKVIMLAQEEARHLGHNFVDTEQIFLGLIGKGTGIDAQVLKSMGINPTAVSYTSYTILENLKNLELKGSKNINGTGNSDNNLIRGNSANNILNGKGGKDQLIGGDGNDTYVVDSPDDLLLENATSGIDLIQASVSYIAQENIEKIHLKGFNNINATGNDDDNVIIGNSANNILNGKGGKDKLIGGNGNDTYIVDSVDDLLIENAGKGDNDLIKTSIDYTISDNIENLILTGIAPLKGIGNNLNNNIQGNTGDNTLDGGDGNDTINGGDGSDIINGNDGNDTSSGITTRAIISGSVEDNDNLRGGLGDDTLNGGGGNDTIDGGDGNDIINGSDADDTSSGITTRAIISGSVGDNDNLKGGLGDDSINGLDGNDTLTGGDGNDTLTGGDGNDTLIGGLGADKFVIHDSGTDSIPDFSSGQLDEILISRSIFTLFKSQSAGQILDADNFVVVNSQTEAETNFNTNLNKIVLIKNGASTLPPQLFYNNNIIVDFTEGGGEGSLTASNFRIIA